MNIKKLLLLFSLFMFPFLVGCSQKTVSIPYSSSMENPNQDTIQQGAIVKGKFLYAEDRKAGPYFLDGIILAEEFFDTHKTEYPKTLLQQWSGKMVEMKGDLKVHYCNTDPYKGPVEQCMSDGEIKTLSNIQSFKLAE